jgi:hypothetical protein
MTEQELLNTWKENNYVNPDGIKAAYDLIEKLLARIEALEAKVK